MFCSKQVMIGASKSIWGFDPRNIPGCVVWLDAADSNTLTLSGSNITAWRDKSTFSNNVNSISATAPTYNSTDSSVNFVASSGTFLRGTMSATYSNSASVFVVASIATQSTPAFPRLSMLGSSATANSILIGQQLYVNGGNTSVITYLPTGTNPASQGINIMTLVSNVTYNTRQLITNVSSYIGTTFTISTLLNGDSQNTSVTTRTGTFTASGGNVATYNKYSLANYPDAASTTGDSYSGKIFEYLVFNSALTTAQRQQVEGYLANKWGLSGYYSPILPLTISGCTMWLDGDDPNGTGIYPLTGALATWVDKSGNGRNGIQYSSFALPQFIRNSLNSRGGISFTAASSNCYQTQVVLPTPGTIFVVGFSSNNGFILSGIPTPNSGHPPYYATFARDVEFGINNTSDTAHSANVASTSNTNYILTGLYTGSNVTALMNGGTLSNTVSFSGTPKTPVTTLIGINSYAGSLGSPIGGTINEFITYSTALTTAQRQQVEGYLARKWGFTTIYPRLPITHPYYSLKPHLRVFQPTDISGCVLWLDAADSSSITLSGSNMTRWTDKSTTGRNMVPFSTYSNATVSSNFQNNLNVLNFSGAGVYQAPASSIIYPVDLYIVMALKDLTTHVDVVSMTASAADNFNSLSYSEYTSRRWHNGSTGYSRTPNTVSTSNETSTSFLLMNWSIINGDYVLRRNGTLMTQTGSYTWTPTAASIFQIGFRASPSLYSPATTAGTFRGYIGEIVAFNKQLGDSQRQEVEGYLANKWNLNTSLPSTHPFYKFPPCAITRPNFKELAYTTPDFNVFFAKYSPDGSVLWALRWTATGGAAFQDSATDSSGNVYVTGLYISSSLLMYDTKGNLVRTLSNSGGYDGLVAKYTSSGDLLWTSRHIGPVTTYPTGVAVDSSGNVYAGGTWDGASLTIYSAGEGSSNVFGTTGGQTDGYIVKYNSSGIVQWSLKIVCSSYDNGGTSLKTDSSGNLYSVGINVFAAPTFYNANGTTGGSLAWNGTTEGMWLAKWNSSGTFQWALRFVTGDLNTSQGALCIDSSANLYVCSAYDSTLTLKNTGDGTAATMSNAGSYDSFLVKYSSAGSYIWNARVGGTGSADDIANAIDGSGNVYIMGRYTGTIIIYTSGEASSTTLGNSGGYDNYIAKYTSAGVLLWATRMASTGNEYQKGISVDLAGNVYVHGSHEGNPITFYNVGGSIGGTLTRTAPSDAYLAKYTTNGLFVWAALITGLGSGTENGNRSITDPEGNIYVGGNYSNAFLILNGV